jgi:hypothetical protein
LSGNMAKQNMQESSLNGENDSDRNKPIQGYYRVDNRAHIVDIKVALRQLLRS